MASTRQIINDLRAQANAVDGRRLRGETLQPFVRSMCRAADELERLLDELHLLRAFAEIPQEVE